MLVRGLLASSHGFIHADGALREEESQIGESLDATPSACIFFFSGGTHPFCDGGICMVESERVSGFTQVRDGSKPVDSCCPSVMVGLGVLMQTTTLRRSMCVFLSGFFVFCSVFLFLYRLLWFLMRTQAFGGQETHH